ncbi:hypothetical protein [Streptomyces sp. NPDC003487]|jgi:hypothetical protein
MSTFTQWKRAAALAVLPAVGALAFTGLGAGQAQAAAAHFYQCDKTATSIPRKKVTSHCYVITSVGTKKASQHRAKAVCDQDHGTGPFIHSHLVTVHGPWVALGKKSSVTCPLRSTLVAGYTETR